MNKEHIVLRYLLENNQWITITHDMLFQLDLLKIKLLANQTIKQGRSVSIQQIGLVFKEEGDTGSLKALKLVYEASQVDKAVFEKLREDLRKEAKLRVLKQIQDQTLNDKQYSDVLKDLLDLEKEDKPEELDPPVSFKDWSKHIAPSQVYLDSGIEPFQGTGTDTKVGDVFNILAASGNFKTGLMTHITKYQLQQGRNVLFYSMEETAQSFNARVGQGLLGLTEYQYSKLSEAEIAQRFAVPSLEPRLCHPVFPRN